MQRNKGVNSQSDMEASRKRATSKHTNRGEEEMEKKVSVMGCVMLQVLLFKKTYNGTQNVLKVTLKCFE